MNKNILKLRIILWLILAVAIGWFFYMKIAPTGKISYNHDFSRPYYFIGKLTPAERIDLTNGEAEIKGGPVYFSLATPRRFRQAGVTVKFKNTTAFPVMEMGLLNNKAAWSYDLKPLENKIIDQLSLVWPAAEAENGVRLIEREKKYKTVEDFLSNLPPKNEIALYNYSIKNNFLLAGYEPGFKDSLIDYRFRGSYQFYTYIKQERLDYTFNFVDLNVDSGGDKKVLIKVYSPDGLIHSAEAEVKQSDMPIRAGERTGRAVIKIDDLAEGVYRFSVIAHDEIMTKNILSRQSRFVLINKAWLARGNKANLNLFTDSRLINAQTVNPASLGKIKAGGSFLDLKETYKQFYVKDLSGTSKIELPKDDIIISGDGVFSFTEGGLFNPKFKNVDGNLNIKAEKINYVLTAYKTPLTSDGWQIAQADFDLSQAYEERGKYQFLISVPNFRAEEEAPGKITIKEIRVDLTGISWREKLKRYFRGS